ncbi:Brp/Blh family beta-carotene 15,15'-dioxygenase [Salinirubellus salinus]|uniref:Brp/Blh family beta-carotene 15,15'-dioxygenase n=1 Tax=Salinirubellus salinus TaxID=1364945 RepID=UPI0034A191B4
MALVGSAFDGRYAAVRETLDGTAIRPVWVLHALVVLPFALGLEVPLVVQYVPLAVSALLLGLPHGAVDHLAPTRVRGEAPTLRSLAGVGVLYGVLGGAYLAAWFLAPVASFGFFIAMTWAHWGQGDVHALVALEGVEHLRTTGQRVATLVVRGGLPMLVPLLLGVDQYREVATLLVGRFGVEAAALDPLFRVETRLALGVGFALLTVATLAVGLARAPGGLADAGWRRDAGETTLLWAFFLAVPPILAVGVYFCLWHAVRHVARLVTLDSDGERALRRGDAVAALAGFYRDAAPLTLVSLAFLAGFYWLVPVRPGTLPETVGLYLVLIAVLTLPHVVVVSLMDRVEGVWRVA